MINIVKARLSLGKHTARLPEAGKNVLPENFRGLPVVNGEPCAHGCSSCQKACPTGAIAFHGPSPAIDLGKCIFCPECVRECPRGVLGFTPNHRLSGTSREGLTATNAGVPPEIEPLTRELRGLFGRSLKLRQVSAGGCNGCEAELIVTGTPVFDLGRFGVQFVASPRHADALVVTGPVSDNMKLALEKTYRATPAPKLVIACGACAISGGVFAGNPEVHDGVAGILPVDLYIPGCPPHPWTILDGMLRLLGTI